VAKAEAIAAAIPGARLEVVPDAGHSSTVEQPEAVTRLMESFLAEH
jgi:pimeloyl-ACP methyl ester carboxylesterase